MGTTKFVGRNIKKEIYDSVKAAIDEYEQEKGISTEFGDPIIGYCNARHKGFDALFARQLCDHPSKIYRAGNTVIVFCIPYSEEVIASNKGGDKPSEQWIKAYQDSTMLIMRVNRVIRGIVEDTGRLVSCLNTPLDWIESQQREEWSYKMAAYIAGMGHYGMGGSFVTEAGFVGRMAGLITDGQYFDPDFNVSDKNGDEFVDEMISPCNFKGSSDININEEVIAACPGGAISSDGIDKVKCQGYCKTINEYVPCSDVCGKCYYYK